MSGKGGVGKSNLTLNMALSIASTGKQVLIIDLDFGMGNIDILLGKTSTSSILDVLVRKILPSGYDKRNGQFVLHFWRKRA